MPVNSPAGTAITTAISTIIAVPVIPLSIPPGTGSLFAFATMACRESGEVSEKKPKLNCPMPSTNIFPIISRVGIMVTIESEIIITRNKLFFLNLDFI
jgi:hypothetical protein